MNNLKNVLTKIGDLIAEIANQAKKKKLISIFTLATTANVNNPPYLFPTIRETKETIAANLLIRTLYGLTKIIKAVDGKVDLILVDVESKQKGLVNLEKKVRQLTKKSLVFSFKPNELTAEAVDCLLGQLINDFTGRKTVIVGAGNLGSKIALRLIERRANISLIGRNKKKLKNLVQGLNVMKAKYVKSFLDFTTDSLPASQKADILIGTTPGIPVITDNMVRAMNPLGIILDVGNGTLTDKAIVLARKKKIKILCPTAKPGYDGAIVTLLQTQNLIKRIGCRKLNGFCLISGGILGDKGDVIVDDFCKPTKILGVADGRGDVIHNIKPYGKNLAVVKILMKE